MRDGFRDEGREASFRRLARFEASGSLQLALNPIDAKRSPITAGEIPGHEIPAIAGVYKPVWLNRSRSSRSGAIMIGKANSIVIATGVGYKRQTISLNPWGATFEGNDKAMQRCHPAAQTRRQHLFQLHQGSH